MMGEFTHLSFENFANNLGHAIGYRAPTRNGWPERVTSLMNFG